MNKIHNLVNMNIVNRMLLSLAMFLLLFEWRKSNPIATRYYTG